jgi:glycosyltransferase involved in cell wall biosynthesis
MKTTVIALLDKEYPPHHSFVDGMLAGALGQEPEFTVRLVVSVGTQANINKVSVHRYGRATCLPLLFQRRGAGRFANFLVVLWAIRPMVLRERARGHRVVLFVRNCPVLLLAARLLRKDIDRLVFQSSFPHEETAAWFHQRWLARSLYRLSTGGIDALLALSPLGLERIGRLFPGVDKGEYIPLAAGSPDTLPPIKISSDGRHERPTKFIYIGTHHPIRRLDFVLRGILQAVQDGANGRFVFIGGKENDVQRLIHEEGIPELVRDGILTFHPPISRPELLQRLGDFDVGLSLIPNTTLYRESSPTKLTEYMGAGLAILATTGIPLQEKFVRDSQAGVLVGWSSKEIAQAIKTLCADPEGIRQMQCAAKRYAEKTMNYSAFLETFKCLL